jgi:D-alanyl-D-alanine carboxypeptidase
MVLCLAAVFWSIMYKNEKEKKEFNLQLSLESFQNNLFAKFVENSAWVYHSSGDREFTKQHFLDYLTSYRSGHLEKLKIDIVLAESLANVILDRAVRKGVIKKDTKISLQDSYIILSR